MDGGAWWATVHGVAKSRTRLSDFTFTFHFHALEKEMATHSSVLAWRIPGTGEPGGLPSMGSHRVSHNWSDLAAAAATLSLHRNLAVSASAGLLRWLSSKESAYQCRRHRRCGFDLWVGKIPWRREWQITASFLPGKFHGQRSLAGYSPGGSQRVKHSWVTEHARSFSNCVCDEASST